jgi:small-conductance mechanosensitive channel
LQRVKIRRVVFTVGLVYQTPPERLRAVPDIVETIMQEIEDVRYGWAHFTEYGDSSLNFEIAFFVRGHDLSTFRKKRHAVNLAIFERFAEEGLEFAYPTRTLFHETTDAPPNSDDVTFPQFDGHLEKAYTL